MAVAGVRDQVGPRRHGMHRRRAAL